jgi:Rieske Fe-S protein
MTDLAAMQAAYQACADGTDQPDCLVFDSYDAYVATCQHLGIIPVTEAEMS